MISNQDIQQYARVAANYYMLSGIDDIASAFDVRPNSRDHVELCKALLPAYVHACSTDFDAAMRFFDKEQLSWVNT